MGRATYGLIHFTMWFWNCILVEIFILLRQTPDTVIDHGVLIPVLLDIRAVAF